MFGLRYLEAEVLKTEVALTEISLYSPAQASIELTSTGYVEPQVVTRVGAKIPGKIARVHVREGDRVKAGQLLLELEHADRQAGDRVRAACARPPRRRASRPRARTWSRRGSRRVRQRQLAQTRRRAGANAEDLEARAVVARAGQRRPPRPR